jgi:hypothetical protein
VGEILLCPARSRFGENLENVPGRRLVSAATLRLVRTAAPPLQAPQQSGQILMKINIGWTIPLAVVCTLIGVALGAAFQRGVFG